MQDGAGRGGRGAGPARCGAAVSEAAGGPAMCERRGESPPPTLTHTPLRALGREERSAGGDSRGLSESIGMSQRAGMKRRDR